MAARVDEFRLLLYRRRACRVALPWHSAPAVRDLACLLVLCAARSRPRCFAVRDAGRAHRQARARRRPRRPRRSSAPKLDVKSWTLANGLKVLFLADHKAPIATVQVFYHVGSKDEHVGIRGVAHMFEHMMFKGSTHVPPEEHARLLKEVGGQVNAFTTEDLTAYHDTVPPSYVGFAMKLEAERMRNLKLFPATVDSERQVVEEEKRLRVDNDPVGKALERFRALAYTKHPYNWTPIGDDRGAREGHARGLPALLRHLLPAQQRDADRRRRYRRGRRCASWPTVLRGARARARAAARRRRGAGADGAARGDAAACRCSCRWSSAGITSRAGADPDIPRSRCCGDPVGGDRRACTSGWCATRDLAVAAGGLSSSRTKIRGCSSSTPRYLPDPMAARCRRRSPTRSRACATKPVTREELQRPKISSRRGSCSGCRRWTASHRRWAAQYVEDDWRRFVEGAARYLAVTAEDVQRVARSTGRLQFDPGDADAAGAPPAGPGPGGTK